MNTEAINLALGEITVQAWRNQILRRNSANDAEVHRPLYYSLAAECRDNGSAGLRSLTRKLVAEGCEGTLLVGSELFKTIPEWAQRRFLNNYAKVVAGIVLMGADHILAGEGDFFSNRTFWNWHNKAVEGTFIPEFRQGEIYHPYPTDGDREEMLRSHKEDETNLALIGDKVTALPLFVQENINTLGILAPMQNGIRPFLKKVAEELKPYQLVRATINRSIVVPNNL